MVQVKAIWDGTQVILPPEFRGAAKGEITVSFPEELVLGATARGDGNVWDILDNDGYKGSGRTMNDLYRQLREMRDDWDDDPRGRLRGMP